MTYPLKNKEWAYLLKIKGLRREYFATGTKRNPIRDKRIIKDCALKPVKDYD
jgi:hypothetical protein